MNEKIKAHVKWCDEWRKTMLTRTQCEESVRSQQKELNELKAQLNFITNKSVKDAVKNRIAFLEDNIYRYKLQIKAFERNGKGLET